MGVLEFNVTNEVLTDLREDNKQTAELSRMNDVSMQIAEETGRCGGVR